MPVGKNTHTLRCPAGAARQWTVTCYDLELDELGSEVGRTRTDLTGATVYFALKPADGGATVVAKTSADAAQIQLLDQAQAATKGQAVIKLLQADTDALTPGKYHFDVWVKLADGRVDAIIDQSPFFISPQVADVPIS